MTCCYQPMSTTLSHHSLRVLESQVTWLSERRCRVRGTFIELFEPESCLARHKRTKSMPAVSRCTEGLELPLELALSKASQHAEDSPSGASSSSTGSTGNSRPTTLSLFDRLGQHWRPKSPRSESVSTTCSWRENEEQALEIA